MLSFQRFFLLAMISMLLSCQTATNKQNLDLPDVDPNSIGKIRIAIIAANKKGNVLLINQSNTRYLKAQSFAKGQAREKLPLTSLKYQSDHLSCVDNTVVVIVENEVMAKLLALLQRCSYTNYAIPCTKKQISSPDWPEREAIFFDDNGSFSAFIKNAHSLNQAPQASQRYLDYRTLKFYILQAQTTGYKPMHVLLNIDGKKIFRENQKNLEKNYRQKKNRLD